MHQGLDVDRRDDLLHHLRPSGLKKRAMKLSTEENSAGKSSLVVVFFVCRPIAGAWDRPPRQTCKMS